MRHRVFLVAQAGFPDQAQAARLNVIETAYMVDDAPVGVVPVQRIDREVAAQHILFQAAEAIVAQYAAAGPMHNRTLRFRSFPVGTTKRGHLNVLATEHDVREAEAPADQDYPAKQLLYLLRPGVRDDVKVLGPQIQ